MFTVKCVCIYSVTDDLIIIYLLSTELYIMEMHASMDAWLKGDDLSTLSLFFSGCGSCMNVAVFSLNIKYEKGNKE